MVRRTWTPETLDAWRNERNERIKSKGYGPFHTLNPTDKAEVLEAERRGIIETEISILTTQAWNIGKRPLLSYASPFAGFIHLPNNYQSRDGTHKLRVHKGDDLNRIVYQYYDEVVDGETYPGDNFVSKDGIRPRRHEYLGPSPRIASYRTTGNEIEIEWWEEYINDTWIGNKKWKVEAEFDATVEGWFLADRSDC